MPICEMSHWYLALICYPNKFLNAYLSEQMKDDDQTTPERVIVSPEDEDVRLEVVDADAELTPIKKKSRPSVSSASSAKEKEKDISDK